MQKTGSLAAEIYQELYVVYGSHNYQNQHEKIKISSTAMGIRLNRLAPYAVDHNENGVVHI